MSGETSASGSPPRGLARMRKPRSPAGATSRGRTASIDASGGASSREPAQEAVDRAVAALDLDQHAPLVVEHEPREVELGREAVDERAGSRPPEPSPRPCARTRLTATKLPEHVVRARLRLLDPRDVLGAGDRRRGRRAPPPPPARRRSRRSAIVISPRLRASTSAAITLPRVAAGRQRDQRVARPAVGDHLAREDRVGRRCRWRAR